MRPDPVNRSVRPAPPLAAPFLTERIDKHARQPWRPLEARIAARHLEQKIEKPLQIPPLFLAGTRTGGHLQAQVCLCPGAHRIRPFSLK
jgi:hypothetical protein